MDDARRPRALRHVLDAAGRPLRALRRRRGRRLHIVFHPDYCRDQPAGPYDLMRPHRILHYLRDRGLLRRGMLHRPRPASLKRLQLVHTTAYLDALEQPDALQPILGFAVAPDLQDAFLAGSRAMTGGTILAAKLALRHGGVAANLGGGFHHAYVDRGHGFSCFNDVAVAVRTFRERGFDDAILVLDLDLHDGDGTRAIFADDPTVHTFSLHNHTQLQVPALADTCVALGADIDDATMLAAVREHLPRVLAAVRPQLVFYVAGSDGHRRDRLGDWRLSHDGLVARDRLVLDLLRALPEPPGVVYLLAGGYGAHAWRHPAATLSALAGGDPVVRPPLELELPLDHYRGLQGLFARPDLDRAREGDWSLSDADLPGLAGVAATLFLDAIPRHGLELALERSGLLDRLRRLGYRKLQTAVDLGDPTGHLVRVQDIAAAPPRPLLEIKLRRDTVTMPGHGLLSVEWLLLQHAGGTFVLDQPPLAGQQHPGLGLLRDISALLVVMAERLDLDGLAFRPAHFHMAEIARYNAVFLDDDAARRHEAARQAMRGLRLAEMDTALATDRLVDAHTGEPYRHEPAIMVVPVTRRLQEWRRDAEARRAGAPPSPGYRLLARM
jgi:acetoin utilization deacetylase AcuC-like enzyme